MAQANYNSFNARSRLVLYYALSLCCVVGLMVVASTLRPKPVDETVTVDSSQAKISLSAPTVDSRQLPVVDPDIETAGDRIAAAVIYLKRRQSEPALNALQQAQIAANQAVTRKPEGSKIKNELQATNQEIETVKELIRKGRLGYATRELKDVDQRLELVSY
jgi:hypothetical protein